MGQGAHGRARSGAKAGALRRPHPRDRLAPDPWWPRSATRRGADPDLARFLAHVESGRYLGPSGIAALLAEKDALRRGLEVSRAADAMYAISSFEGYELLVTERGWTPDEYERWLTDTLCALLLEPTQ